MSHTYNFLAINQWGDKVLLRQYPRKELMKMHGVQHADKMYVDDRDGKSHHIGYVVSGSWYTVYKLSDLHEEA